MNRTEPGENMAGAGAGEGKGAGADESKGAGEVADGGVIQMTR